MTLRTAVGGSILGLTVLAATICALWLRPPAAAGAPDSPSASSSPRASAASGTAKCATPHAAALPSIIVPNAGQWPADVAFVARVDGRSTAFRRDRIEFGPPAARPGASAAPSGPLALVFAGADDRVQVRGDGPQPGRANYFLGNDPGAWVRNVPLFSGLTYAGLYDGIDLAVHTRGGGLEYDLLLAPGADLQAVRVRCEGARGVRLADDGALLLDTPDGTLRQAVVAAWQTDAAGASAPVACAFELRDADGGAPCFGFAAPGRDRAQSLVVDPSLQFSTLLGGSDGDLISALAVDAAGESFVAGYTGSTDFPVTPGAYSTSVTGTNGDIVVAKLSAAGDSLIWATYIGGTASESVAGIAVDASGAACVAGDTFSTNFPVTAGAAQTVSHGGNDAFVFKLDPTGSTLVYSTLFGGSQGDKSFAFALAPNGEACVVGETFSTDLPVTPHCFDFSYNGAYPSTDAFIARLAADGSKFVFATYLGSSSWDSARGVAIDDQGYVYVTGFAQGTDFPTTPGAFSTVLHGSSDVFVTKLTPDKGLPVYSTYLGGSNSNYGYAIAVDAAHAAYVTGKTTSHDFPVTAGAFDVSYNGSDDVFVAKLLPEGRALAYATFFGTSSGGGEASETIAVDRAGAPNFLTIVNYPGLPVTPDAFQSVFGGDIFTADQALTKLHPTGSSLVYSTYFVGTGGDYAGGVALDGQGGTYLDGYTYSIDLPVTAGAYQTVREGDTDGFIAKFDLPLGPWTLLQGGSHGTVDVPNLVGFGPLSDGSSNGVELRGAPAGAAGVLFVGLSAVNLPLAKGVLVPAPDFLLFFSTDAKGRYDLPFTWPSGVPSGVDVWFQAWLHDTGAFAGKSSSNAVRATTP